VEHLDAPVTGVDAAQLHQRGLDGDRRHATPPR
jgi:hypothetical protein